MELTVLLVFAAAVAASAAIIYFIMAVGMKEKTYEEAIAEQRNRPDEHLLLGRATKDKQKDKKVKKAGKKVKEKTDKVQAPPKKTAHVVFVQPEAVIADSTRDDSSDKKEIAAKVKALQQQAEKAKAKKDKENIPEPQTKKPEAPKKAEKASPLKQQAPAKADKQPAPAKTEKQPAAPAKNEKQQAAAKVEKQQAAPAKNEKQQAPAKAEKPAQAAPAKAEKQQAAAKVEKQQAVPAKNEKQAPAKVEKPVQAAPAKEKQQAAAKVEKQQASPKIEAPKQAAPKQQQQAPKEVAKIEKQVTAVRVEKQQNAPNQKQQKGNALAKNQKKTTKPVNEMDVIRQMAGELERVNMSLIEPLLLKSDLSLSEIQQLIDLLLNKQMASGVEKSEWIEGRQDPMMKLKKAFAEKEKDLEKAVESNQALNVRLKMMSAERLEERTRSSQTVRALDEEKKMITKKLESLEEAFRLDKVNLLNQIQQLQAKRNEDHVLIRKLKEDESKVAELLKKIQQLESLVQAEAQQHASSRMMAEKQLRQKDDEMQAVTMSLSQKIEEEKALHAQAEDKFKNFANSLQGREAHIKELTAAKDELERQLMAFRQREAESKAEVGKLNDKIMLEHDKFMSQAAEIQRLHEENQRLREQRSDVPQLQNQVLQLQDENGALMSRLMAATERPAAEGRENGDVAEEKHNEKLMSAQLIHEEALREKDLEMEKLSEKVKQTDKLAAEVKLANGTVEKLKSEMNAQKTEILRLTEEVEAQRKKNDETKLGARLEEQKACRELLMRIFPDITVEETTVHEQWLKKFADAVRKDIVSKKSVSEVEAVPVSNSAAELAELEKQNCQLQSMVNHYKTTIVKTEGMLSKLQSHIEQEEAKWRGEMEAKEAELEAVKRERDQQLENGSNPEMQSQLKELEQKLLVEEAEKRDMETKWEKAQAEVASMEALRERLSEDVKSLTAEKQLAENAARALEQQLEELRADLQKSKESSPPSNQGSVQSINGATNGPASSEVPVSPSEKASKPRKLTGWIKKKVGKSASPQQSPNLSAGRHDDFISAERAESS